MLNVYKIIIDVPIHDTVPLPAELDEREKDYLIDAITTIAMQRILKEGATGTTGFDRRYHFVTDLRGNILTLTGLGPEAKVKIEKVGERE